MSNHFKAILSEMASLGMALTLVRGPGKQPAFDKLVTNSVTIQTILWFGLDFQQLRRVSSENIRLNL